MGTSIRAAEAFLNGLSSRLVQIATTVGWEEFPLHLRIKAHRGEVFVAPDSKLDSADPRNFDDFLKFEKKFAPRHDELFITHELFTALKQATKATFVVSRKLTAGSLCTTLYRWRRLSGANRKTSYQLGSQSPTLSQNDLDIFCEQFEAQLLAQAACTQITKGLISAIREMPSKRHERVITPDVVLNLTLDALYSYLQLIFTDCRVRVSYWHGSKQHRQRVLKMLGFRYPDGESTNPKRRIFPIEEEQWKVCECFKKMKFVVTSDVAEARNNRQWYDFDKGQRSDTRRLDSAMQIPVYCEGIAEDRQSRGVLSLDVDKPDLFWGGDIHLWRERLVGFLAALALSEKMRNPIIDK